MVRHFLERGGQEVLWINPYPGRLPRLADLRRPVKLHDQGTPPDARVRVVDFRALPIEPLPGGFALNMQIFGRRLLREAAEFASRGDCVLGVGKPCALTLALMKALEYQWSFYDAMDDFPLFHSGLSRKSMVRREQLIANRVADVFVSSSFLAEKFFGGPAPVTGILNACNPDILPVSPKASSAAEQVIGYIGSMGDWFDWECVFALALAVPSCEIRLVGPHLVPPPEKRPRNVKLFPACRHEEVGRYLGQFNVGLIPFRKTPLTQGVDPIKYYEYRAAGLPVLSTGFGEMALRKGEPGVFILEDFCEPAAAIQSALSFQPEPEKIRRWRTENSWQARFAAVSLFDHLFAPAP